MVIVLRYLTMMTIDDDGEDIVVSKIYTVRPTTLKLCHSTSMD